MKKYAFAAIFLGLAISVNSGTLKKYSNEDLTRLIKQQAELCTPQKTQQKIIKKKVKEIPFTIEERLKVTELCTKLNIKEEHLYEVMRRECNFNHKAINKKSKAVGLIQFLPKTARKLGTSTDSLLNMTKLEQLDYVYKYFKPISEKYKLNTLSNVHLAVFYPRALGKKEDFILGEKGSKVTNYNKTFDLNNDSILTVGEFNQKFNM